MDKANSLYLPRKVLRRDAHGQELVYPLEQSRTLPAYVLLGEPGSGKTDSFEHEAQACGGHYVKARNFSLLKEKELAGKIVFIDGLDERRAVGGSGHTPLEHIREQLDRLGRPRFRLSCREADWLGDSDHDALAFIAPTGAIEVLHLEPLGDKDVISLLGNVGVADPKEFFKKARQHQLDDALRNPNTLKLLAKAVGDSDWPESKAQIFERACHVLARDISVEHQTAAPGPPPPIDKLLEAAGYLCAVLLLSGDEGITLFDLPGPDGIVPLSQLAPSELPLVQALRTNLFRGPIDSGRTYLHRSVAEFLAARYIAERIEEDGLPVQRILAACTGKDGGVAPDLRGLCAWLSVYSRTARLVFVDRDPLGVVLYGDVSTFMPDDKRRVFAALKREAERYPGFRSSDWTTEPFGALSTKDMLETISDLLRTPATTDGEQSFQDCVMDAVKHGEPMPSLEPLLERIARDPNYWPSVRWTAMEAIERVNPGKNCLSQLLEDIRVGTVKDRDDDLLGHLLNHLYARGAIGAKQVLDYLHPPKQENLIGRYRQFWSPELAEMARDVDLPILLEELAKRRKSFEDMREHYIVTSLFGELLVRTLEVHGGSASDDEIYAWLTAGQDKWGNVRLEHDEEKQVSAWISARPERYKMLAARPIEDCRTAADVAACLRHLRSRLFDAKAPTDIVEWYLAKASDESQPDIAEYYFHQAVIGLMRRDAPNWPSEVSLDLLDLWVAKFPRFLRLREEATSCPLDHWEREESQRKKKRKAEAAPRMKEIRDHYRKHMAQIQEGTAPPHVMSELAQVHDGRIIEGRGDTPEQRLDNFFEGDAALVEATLAGLPRVPEREDLPAVDEIISTDLDKKRHYIREAALVGMELKYKADRESAFALPQATLEKLCAFWLVKGTSEQTDWYEALAQAKPEVVAAAVVPYAQRSIKAKKEHVTGVWQLGHSEEMSAVAALVLPTLLETFPLRCQAKQLERYLDPMLKGALAHMPRSDLAALVASKLDRATLDAPQRVYWLATGLLIDAPRYQKPLIDFVKGSAARRGYLAYFLGQRIPQRMPPIEELRDSAVIALVELLGPEAPSEFARGSRRRAGTRTDNLGQLVRILIQSLEQRGSDAALRALERMLDIPNLAPWGNFIRSTLNTIRLSQRKATIPQLTPRQASEIVSNQQPANAGDLAAIAVGHLRDVARKIRDGATNDYKQYWNLENNSPKVENLCRDALLSQLEERLAKHGEIGIPANKEAYVADERRVDTMVSYGGSNGFSVPVEVKVESYRKGKETVWTALRTQLIDRYSHFPTAKGHGIYVVFWFGGKNLPPSPTGVAPKTPAELEAQLRATLAPEDSRIEVVVIDCSLPTKMGA